jgi:hypothetical protein
MKISYAITCCNEIKELQNLVPFLIKNKNEKDEIIILFDCVNGTNEVREYLKTLTPGNKAHFSGLTYNPIENYPIRWYSFDFNNDFSEMKNFLTQMSSGDFIVNIDADEIPSIELIKLLPSILENNPDVDLYLVPRENYVEGITKEHLIKWGWVLDEKNRINYPDAQSRIYRNIDTIKWVNKVHETITGHKQWALLPDELCLFHYKTIDKQEKQNELYSKL